MNNLINNIQSTIESARRWGKWAAGLVIPLILAWIVTFFTGTWILFILVPLILALSLLRDPLRSIISDRRFQKQAGHDVKAVEHRESAKEARRVAGLSRTMFERTGLGVPISRDVWRTDKDGKQFKDVVVKTFVPSLGQWMPTNYGFDLPVIPVSQHGQTVADLVARKEQISSFLKAGRLEAFPDPTAPNVQAILQFHLRDPFNATNEANVDEMFS